MLALVPAGFLVLMLLAALAVDSAVAYLGQQQLHDALTAAANDAVAAGLDNRTFYSSGALSLDPAAVEQEVCSSVRAQDDGGLHHMHVAVAVSGTSVDVTGSAVVDEVFGRAIPGFAQRPVHSSAGATLEASAGGRSPAATGPPSAVQC